MKPTKKQCEFIANGTSIPYTLIKSDNRRSVSVQMKPGGEMIVKIPYYVTMRMLKDFLYEKQEWIYTNYVESLTKSPSSVRKQEDLSQVNAYKKQARLVITNRVQYYSQFTKNYYHTISIRDQKTRWGSCSGKGNLSFNWRLILAPPEILDYVVVHELCHLTHLNHSKDFWNMVGNILPDYKIRRKWLKENGHTLHL